MFPGKEDTVDIVGTHGNDVFVPIGGAGTGKPGGVILNAAPTWCPA